MSSAAATTVELAMYAQKDLLKEASERTFLADAFKASAKWHVLQHLYPLAELSSHYVPSASCLAHLALPQ